jgi:hypothetical protein
MVGQHRAESASSSQQLPSWHLLLLLQEVPAGIVLSHVNIDVSTA